MQPRRSLRLLSGALVLALPLLASCGFDKATDRVYTPAAGTNDRDGDVDVLSAVIVSAQPGSGTFIASLSNNDSDKAYTLTGVAGSGEWTDLKVEPTDLSVEIPARGFVNLLDEDPISVTGDFDPGELAELTLSYDSGDTTTLDVPVVYACNYYDGLDTSASSGSSASASPSDSVSPGEVPTEGTTPSATESSSESSSESPSEGASEEPAASGAAEPYDCGAVGEG